MILGADLAVLYGVVTWRLHEQVKRNQARFPDDFVFQLTSEEDRVLTSQIARSKLGFLLMQLKDKIIRKPGLVPLHLLVEPPRHYPVQHGQIGTQHHSLSPNQINQAFDPR